MLGGILCISSLLGAIFLFYRDIFSVAKDKNQTDLPEVKLMTIYVHAGFLIWIWNYSIICFEFCFVSCSDGVLVGRRRVLSCYR